MAGTLRAGRGAAVAALLLTLGVGVAWAQGDPGPSRGYVLDMFRKGGVFMYPILACSVLGLGIILERLVTLTRAQVDTRRLLAETQEAIRTRGLAGGIEVSRTARGPVAAMLHAGLRRAHRGPEAVDKALDAAGAIEIAFLSRGLIWLSTVVVVAPLLGFLGTVSGMIHAFDAIAAAEQVSAKLVASGISEALITTAAGLIVAIPVQAANNYFLSRIDRFVLEMEEAAAEFVDLLADRDAAGGS